MRIIGRLIGVCLALGMLALCGPEGPRAQDISPPLIQVAVLLDTSGSMSGLIDQAKAQLWNIVSEFARAEREGVAPRLQVALYEYGKSSIPKEQGYLRMIQPLTDDLDKISEELFVLTTNGGEEYCGQVIMAAVTELAWDEDPGVLKTIFIAGNEPFTQGSVDYRKACAEAVARGITVNTIHCGSDADGVRGMWKDGALLADGSYFNIDHHARVRQIAAPQDAELAKLNAALNTTYVPYGVLGKEGALRQMAQDANAAVVGGVNASERAAAKASGLYSNAGWDLVDAVTRGKVKLEEVTEADLPEAMRAMTPDARNTYLETQEKARAELRQQILQLDAARKTYVAEAMKTGAAAGAPTTLEQAIIQSVRQQAAKKGFAFEHAQPEAARTDAAKAEEATTAGK